MTSRPMGLARFTLAGLCLWLLGAHAAAAFSISAGRIQLSDENPVASVILYNGTATSAIIHAEAFQWNSSSTGDQRPIKARDILVSPRSFHLAQGASQEIRLRERQRTSNRERTYRLVIGEIPNSMEVTVVNVEFATKFDLPVFVTPEGAHPEPQWRISESGTMSSAIELSNTGTAHLHVENLVVSRRTDGKAITTVGAPFDVLAGRFLTLPIGTVARGVPLRVEAQTNIGPIMVEFPP
ncbi:MAG: molecular chaperone [Geminicoccaceae bacterium]|nr:molecular chaperone [Geminicoccaceae bacterium]